MKKIAALAVLRTGLAVPAPVDAVTLCYPSSTKVAAKYHHGVAKGRLVGRRQVGQGCRTLAYGSLGQKFYWRNYENLDRGRDGQ